MKPEDTISDIQVHYQQRLKSLYEAPQDLAQIASTATSKFEERTRDEHTDNNVTFEFHLFASDKIKEAGEHSISPPKIKLDSPERENDAPSFVLPRRPHSFHFAEEATGEKAQDYQYAAVTAEDVLKYAAIKWVRSLWVGPSPRVLC